MNFTLLWCKISVVKAITETIKIFNFFILRKIGDLRDHQAELSAALKDARDRQQFVHREMLAGLQVNFMLLIIRIYLLNYFSIFVVFFSRIIFLIIN